MEVVTIVTSVLLAILTAVYVVITKRLLDASVEANAQNKDLFRDNQRLQVYPHVSCHVDNTHGRLRFVLQNHGDSAAGDIDVLIVGTYSEGDLPLEEFCERYVAGKQDIKRGITSTDEGFYGIFHHYVYCSAPPHRQVNAALDFPVEPDTLYILLQFRDVLGNNYYRIYWMFRESLENDRLKIGAIDPRRARTWSRVDYEVKDHSVLLKTSSGEPLPPECKASGFKQIWDHSISAGHIEGIPLRVEDPGQWSTI